jgi:hypothetical protein
LLRKCNQKEEIENVRERSAKETDSGIDGRHGTRSKWRGQGMSITQFEDKGDDGKIEFALMFSDEPIVFGAMTHGKASMRGTEEQFRDLWESLAEMFDFSEEGDDEE